MVFSKDKSLESLQKALFHGNTVAVYNSLLVGKPEFLEPLIQASIKITKAKYKPKTQVLEVKLENISSSDLLFENQMEYSFYNSAPVFTVPAEGKYTLFIKTLEEKSAIDLKLKALGAFTAPRQSPVVGWKVIVGK